MEMLAKEGRGIGIEDGAVGEGRLEGRVSLVLVHREPGRTASAGRGAEGPRRTEVIPDQVLERGQGAGAVTSSRWARHVHGRLLGSRPKGRLTLANGQEIVMESDGVVHHYFGGFRMVRDQGSPQVLNNGQALLRCALTHVNA